MDPRYLSITWLAPGVEKNKWIFVVADRPIFTGFTIPISYFQVFFIFFIRSFFYIFRFCLAFVFSGFSWTTYFAKSKILYSWGYVWALSPKWVFFFKKSVNVLPLGHFNFMWNFRKKSYEAFWRKTIYLLKYWHSDQLTHWQRWFHRIAFCLKAGVTKSNLEVQQFVRYISFKSLFGHALVGLNMPI